jgi:hypothetical protein
MGFSKRQESSIALIESFIQITNLVAFVCHPGALKDVINGDLLFSERQKGNWFYEFRRRGGWIRTKVVPSLEDVLKSNGGIYSKKQRTELMLWKMDLLISCGQNPSIIKTAAEKLLKS